MLELVTEICAFLFVIVSGICIHVFLRLKYATEALDECEEELENLKAKYQDGEKDISYYKKLLHDLADQAHRNGAIAEGLSEELAALKAYNPEEVEEKLRKIREIRAEEERIRLVARIPYDGRMSAKDLTDSLAQLVNAYNTTTLYADGQAMMMIRH